MICINCSSENLKKLGMRWTSGKNKNLGYSCNDCGEEFLVPFSEEEDVEEVNSDLRYVRDNEYISKIQESKRIVFATAVNNIKVNKKFFNSLIRYCETNLAKLVILPLRYRNPSLFNSNELIWYDDLITEYLVENNFEIIDKIRVLGGLKTAATVANPLTGIEGVSKGYSVILGHPQVALKTLHRIDDKYPAIATTTGAITEKSYSSTKVGFRAKFNHSMSALVLEIDDDGDHFMRHLNFDGTGFFDLDWYYGPKTARKSKVRAEALITGDEHAVFFDPEVMEATYKGKDCIVKEFKPKYIVRHDLLDFFSASHHHKHDFFLKYAKHHSEGKWSVKNELNKTIEHINKTTPKNTTNIVIASNHNEHIMKWLNEADPKQDPENALLYHYLMYKMLKQTEMGETNVDCPEPFQLYAEPLMKSDTVFLGRNQNFRIADVELSMHGDKGKSGTKGSSKAFSDIPVKNVTGHIHSPCIDKGNYTVGTSSRFDLSYVSGLSSWDHAHCIIYPNGKRQLLFIRNGKWRAK